MLRRLLLLALLAGGVWWYWTHGRFARQYTVLSGQLESAVNQELNSAGVSDKDILRSLRQERSQMGRTWIETDRRIQIDPSRTPALIQRLTGAAEKLGCSVLRREDLPGRSWLELGKGRHLMQRMEFVPMQAAALRGPEVALVIDDVAYDLAIMDQFAALGVPLTFAILPRDRRSKALADKAVQLQFPVILHMPMEPKDLVHNNPGPSGLYLKMDDLQLRRQFDKNLASVPHIQGINNHMGSAFTEDLSKMTLVMRWLKEKDLFFLDSHTTGHSVARKVAQTVGVPCLINETFLDNEDDQVAIERQLDIVLKLAQKRKRTIAIGHYRRKHLVQALARKIPEFKSHGVSLVGLPAFYPNKQL